MLPKIFYGFEQNIIMSCYRLYFMMRHISAGGYMKSTYHKCYLCIPIANYYIGVDSME